MEITFWGVRGSIAVSGPDFARYGGNTTCLEVAHGGERIILDAGTGLRALGEKLLTEARILGKSVEATLLFTHLHWDHIQGFPFFGPAFRPDCALELFGASDDLRGVFARQMLPPSFPVPLEAGGAPISSERSHRIGAARVEVDLRGRYSCSILDTMPTFEALTLALTRGTVDLASAGEGEIEVEVSAAGVNRADLLQQRGHYPAPPGVPRDVLGLEYAGVVAARGPGAERFALGDRVMGIVGGGAFARRVVVHEREALPIPARLSMTEAAAVPEAFLTAHDALFTLAKLQRGERVLVHAAASGVGTAAIQLARRAGATVVGTTRTPGKAETISGLGAEAVVADGGGFADRVRPVEVIIDLVGGAYFSENLASISALGRWVVLGLVGGGTVELPLGALLSRRITLIGSVLRSRTRPERVALAEAFQNDAGAALAEGLLRPVVDRVFPVDQAADALRRLAENSTIGKLVLEW